MLKHIHSHRNLIGFDEHGIPTVTVKAHVHDPEEIDAQYREVEKSGKPPGAHDEKRHHHECGHVDTETDENAFISDYMNAVSLYRKTFPSKQQLIEQTADPAVREMLLYAEQLGIDTTFDRFDKQQPQCYFGLAGIYCKVCNMGPAVLPQRQSAVSAGRTRT